MTVWEHLKENWTIKKADVKAWRIDTEKPWNQITLEELGYLADELDVLVSDLV